MRIASVHFEAFKSLYDTTAELGNLTVITGANGSGKSNLVDGLVFVSNVYLYGLDFAVSHGGGYENVAHRRTRRARRPVRLVTESEMTEAELRSAYPASLQVRRTKSSRNEQRLFVRHDFSFRADSSRVTADFSVVHERISILDDRRESLVDIVRTADGVAVSRSERAHPAADLIDLALRPIERPEYFQDLRVPDSELMFAPRYLGGPFRQVGRSLSAIRVFQLSPHTSRLSGVASPTAQLERHGENLPGAANRLRRTRPSAWARVVQEMRAIVPNLEDVQITYTEDRRLAVQFRESGLGRAWNASEVSDGTIQALALLIAIYDSRASVLVIEELENALHPWILRQLLRLCVESKRQIIITSHSPVLLNSVDPRSIHLMWMRHGRSYLRPITDFDPDVARAAVDGELSVFDVYDSGLIEEALPQGFGVVPT